MKEIEREVARLEDALKPTAEPPKWEFPFGTFNSPQEAHAHPTMGHYIAIRRQQAFHPYNHSKGVHK